MRIGESFLKHAPAIRRWILTVLLFGMPTLYLYDITFDAFNVPKLALLVVCVSFVGSLRVAEMLVGRSARGLGILKWPALAIAGPLLAAWIFSSHRVWSLFGAYLRYEGLVPYLFVIAAGVLIADAFRPRYAIACRALALAGAFVGGYALLQALGLDPLARGALIQFPYSTVGHSNFLGGFLAISLPLAAAVRADARSFGWLWSACPVLIAVGLILSFSQGAWAAGLGGLSVTAGVLLAHHKPWLRKAGTLIAGAIALAIVALVIRGMFTDVPGTVPDTAFTRSLLWRTALSMTADDPLTGSGPDVFAVESVRYRPPQAALYHGDARPDGAHSVPLSWAVNSGIPGFLGFVFVQAWWITRARRLVTFGPLQAGLCGALVSYLIQSLVSFDQLLLGFMFWALLALFAVSLVTTPPTEEVSQEPVPTGRPIRRLAPVLIVAPLGAIWWSSNFVLADVHFAEGMRAFGEQRVSRAEARADKAISFRNNTFYREYYGYQLGRAANRATTRTQQVRLIAKMRGTYGFLQEFPNVTAMAGQAFWLHELSLELPETLAPALALLERARSLDPFDIGLKIQTADVLFTAQRPEEAVDVLDESVGLLRRYPGFTRFYPDLWGALSIANTLRGDRPAALSALDEAQRVVIESGATYGGCHLFIAELLLDVADPEGLDLPATARLRCPPTSMELVEDLAGTSSRLDS